MNAVVSSTNRDYVPESMNGSNIITEDTAERTKASTKGNNGLNGNANNNSHGFNRVKHAIEFRDNGPSGRQSPHPNSIPEHDRTNRPSSLGMGVNLNGGLSSPGNEKYLIETLKKEINERGSPTSLIESPILRESKKQSVSSSVSSTSDNNFGSHSLSTGNLSSLLKRPGHERSVSNTSVKSAMTPSRRPNNKNVPALSVNIPSNGNNKNGRTLVDQFYSVHETNPIKQDELGEIKYEPVDSMIKSDPAVTNYLLNIDTVIKDLCQQETNNSFSPILEALESINETLNAVDVTAHFQSFTDLKTLRVQLSQLQSSIEQLTQFLHVNSDKINGTYKTEIHRNVEKLNDLLLTLDNLEFRLNSTKSVINNSKQTISNDILNIIEILEFVDNRFIEYSKETRKMRFKQLTMALSAMVLFISIYISIYGL